MTSIDPNVAIGAGIGLVVFCILFAVAAIAEYIDRRRVAAMVREHNRIAVLLAAHRQAKAWERAGYR